MADLDPVFHKHRGVEPVIRARGVCHWFGTSRRTQVLHDVDVALYPGEVVILTGPSGSGKTTLLTLIGALRALEQGQLQVLGRELGGLAAPAAVLLRREIGFIFQHHNLIDALTAGDNVRLAMQLKPGYSAADYRQRPLAVLRDLGLEAYAQAKPGRLSGGQRQRVAIARALVNQPRVVLADEPTAALDEESGRHVVQLLQQLADERGCTVLIVTHDARVIAAANRIVNMVDGRVASDVDIEQREAVCGLLRQCQVFSDSSPSLLADVASHMQPEMFATGQDIVTQGAAGDRFYVLIQGQCDVLQQRGAEITRLARVAPGGFFGELALLHDAPRAATVRAVEPAHALSLAKHHFLRAVSADANLRRHLRQVAVSSG